MKKLILLFLLVALPLTAAPPRPLIYVLNPSCFPTGVDTVLDVYGQNFGGKVSLMVNGKIVPTVIVPSNPADDGGLQHLQTTVKFNTAGYVYVQVRSLYGANISFSNPLAWSYTFGTTTMTGSPSGQPYTGPQITLPAVCNFRDKPWYQETN